MIFSLVRILIGLLLLGTGLTKVVLPYQNFLYAVQAYELLPAWAEMLVARVFPWIELFTGLFLVLGLWSGMALRAALILFAVFVTVLGQGLIRGLDLHQCGCFGQLMSVPPHIMMVVDSLIVLLIFLLLRNFKKTSHFGLDHYFEK